MCLQTNWEAPKIAKRDITVYKLLCIVDYKCAKSPYEGKKYTLGRLYSTKMTCNKDNRTFDKTSERAHKKEPWVKSVRKGFHSASKLSRFDNTILDTYYEEKYKCIIPKGSLYYEGLTGLVVSNQIIVVKRVK